MIRNGDARNCREGKRKTYYIKLNDNNIYLQQLLVVSVRIKNAVCENGAGT